MEEKGTLILSWEGFSEQQKGDAKEKDVLVFWSPTKQLKKQNNNKEKNIVSVVHLKSTAEELMCW